MDKHYITEWPKSSGYSDQSNIPDFLDNIPDFLDCEPHSIRTEDVDNFFKFPSIQYEESFPRTDKKENQIFLIY